MEAPKLLIFSRGVSGRESRICKTGGYVGTKQSEP